LIASNTENRARTAILIRTKDRPIFLKRALESILAQTDSNWCICIINDGGDRKILEQTLSPFSTRLNNRLEIVHFDKSEGRGKGKHLNAGIRATKSDLIAIHDDDDSWDPSFLTRAVEAMGATQAVVTQSLLIKEKFDRDVLVEISREIYEPWQKYEISLFRLAESLMFPPIATLVRRSAVVELGYFDDELGPLEDWEFFLRLFAKYEVNFVEEPLAHYRQRESNEVGSAANSRVNSARVYGQLDTRIRNRLLREDLAAGKIGLGWLVNLSQGHGRLFLELLKKGNS
jgi:glycosyltransferase involved in cell wall biosynthesis